LVFPRPRQCLQPCRSQGRAPRVPKSSSHPARHGTRHRVLPSHGTEREQRRSSICLATAISHGHISCNGCNFPSKRPQSSGHVCRGIHLKAAPSKSQSVLTRTSFSVSWLLPQTCGEVEDSTCYIKHEMQPNGQKTQIWPSASSPTHAPSS